MWCGVRAPGPLVLFVIALAGVGDAGAGETAPFARTPPRTAPVPETVETRITGEFLDEGFEGAFPPAAWTLTGNPAVTGPNRWHKTVDPAYVRTGTAAALVKWQSARVQDEKLASPALDLSGAAGGVFLSFWWYGNPFWAADADFQVHASSDGLAWTELWKMSDLSETGFSWRSTVLDVGAYAGGDLYVRFRYVGQDGADVALDDVRVGAVAPPGPPPNDQCAGAVASGYVISQVAPFILTGDNTYATCDYPLDPATSCTGYRHSGRDLVWAVDVPAGHEITATMTTTGGWDDTLFLLGDCADPAGTCLVGDNALPDGSTLTRVNWGPIPRRWYLIVSGYAQGAGEFTVNGAIRSATAVRGATWGSVKARYR